MVEAMRCCPEESTWGSSMDGSEFLKLRQQSIGLLKKEADALNLAAELVRTGNLTNPLRVCELLRSAVFCRAERAVLVERLPDVDPFLQTNFHTAVGARHSGRRQRERRTEEWRHALKQSQAASGPSECGGTNCSNKPQDRARPRNVTHARTVTLTLPSFRSSSTPTLRA